MSAFLAGVRVLDLSGLLPGPYASMLLADMGAEVIKVESRLGDLMRQAPPKVADQSVWHLCFNRNKQSLGLDLRKPAARRLFLDLTRHSDVVIEGFRPGRAGRLGVGSDACRAANPKLVYCSISGFGQTGPDAGRSGHDLTYLARSGVLGMARDAAGAPVIPSLQLADLAAGTTAALSICAALFDRDRTGAGCHLDISLMESVMPWMSAYLAARQAGTPLDVGTLPLSGRYPFYNVYRTADGGHVALGALEPLFWNDFCRAVERPDLAPLQFAMGDERTTLFESLSALFAGRTTAAWAALFHARDLPAEVVADLDTVLADPHLAERGVLIVVPHPVAGPTLQVASPVREFGANGQSVRPAPDLGADTRAVLSEVLDLGDAAINNLFSDGIVFDAEQASPRQIAPDLVP